MKRRPTFVCLSAMALGLVVSGCSSASHPTASSPTTSPPTTAAPTTTVPGRLEAPKTTAAQDDAYFRDLATIDQSLTTYVNSGQSVALQALLTDGAAFCAFLKRGGGIDSAMESVVIGANSVETQTHLPRSVTTFNAIDSAALIALCPHEQALTPETDRQHIRQLEKILAKSPQATVSAT